MPAHRRREHQVGFLHLAAAAVDDGDRAFRSRREANRGGGVALSPGSSTVKAPIRFCVVTVAPGNAGCARIRARRSTSSIATSFAARSVNGSRSRQRQCIGASFALGAIGVMRW
jgi:hypothetical protein